MTIFWSPKTSSVRGIPRLQWMRGHQCTWIPLRLGKRILRIGGDTALPGKGWSKNRVMFSSIAENIDYLMIIYNEMIINYY